VIKPDRTFQDLIDCLTGRVKRPSDWHSLLSMAATTLTIGTLADVFLDPESRVAVPSEYRDLLEDVRMRSRERDKRMTEQFLELLPLLNSVRVEPIVMKGLARLLSDPQEQSRILSDIDLLIPPGRRLDCVLAMQRQGYQVMVGGEEDLPPVLGRARDVATIDLHTSLKPFYLGLGYEAVAPYCRRTEFASGTALLPAATCHMLLMVLHDQLNDRDYWRGLIDVRHLVDIHRLAQQGIDWPLLASFFDKGTSKRAFEVQMRTARSFLETDIPQEYCGGAWSRLQVLRRRVQLRMPRMRPLLTVLTVLMDPPRESRDRDHTAPKERKTAVRKLRRRLERYLWFAQPGKLC
jgi:hypothetical protein